MLELFLGGILYMGIIQQLENVVLHIDIKFQLDQTNSFTINHKFLHKMIFKKLLRNLTVYYLKFLQFLIFFMVKNWFQTKKYSCKFSQKLIVKKIKIGVLLNSKIESFEFKIDPIYIFLTINFGENLHEYFFVRNQFLIIKNGKKR